MTAVTAELEAVPKCRRTLSTRPVVRLTSWKFCTIGQQLGRSPGFVSLMKALKYGKWILIDLGVDQGTHFKTWTLAIESWSEEQKGKTPQVPECSRWPLGLLQGELSLRRSFSSLCPSRGDFGASDIDIDWLDLENEIVKWITPSFLKMMCAILLQSIFYTNQVNRSLCNKKKIVDFSSTSQYFNETSGSLEASNRCQVIHDPDHHRLLRLCEAGIPAWAIATWWRLVEHGGREVSVMHCVVLQMTLSNEPYGELKRFSSLRKTSWHDDKQKLLRFCPNLLVFIIATCGIWWLPSWCWCPAYRCCWGSTICTLVSSLLVEGFMEHQCTCNVCSFKHFVAGKMVQKPGKEVESTKLPILFRKPGPGVYQYISVYYILPSSNEVNIKYKYVKCRSQ